MSFGYSVGDFVLLIQLAHKTFRNCQKAGEEYNEIACEIRSLHSVLRTLRSEAQRSDSKIFKQDPDSTKELIVTANGCKNVLNTLDVILAKYEGLKIDGEAGAGKKLWQKFRFGSKTEELGVIRGKLITYTSTISVLLDTMQIKATDRVESKIDDGFTEMVGQFEKMRKEIYKLASQARTAERNGSTLSLLSLSTYNGDDKEVWQDFRKELIKKGFRSQSLDKHKAVLQAYMLKLDESGLLEQEQFLKSNQTEGTPWWVRRMYMETINSLEDLTMGGAPSPTDGLTISQQHSRTSSQRDLDIDDDPSHANLASPSLRPSDEAAPTIQAKKSIAEAWMSGSRIPLSERIAHSQQGDSESTSNVKPGVKLVLPIPKVTLAKPHPKNQVPLQPSVEDAPESPILQEQLDEGPNATGPILVPASDGMSPIDSETESDLEELEFELAFDTDTPISPLPISKIDGKISSLSIPEWNGSPVVDTMGSERVGTKAIDDTLQRPLSLPLRTQREYQLSNAIAPYNPCQPLEDDNLPVNSKGSYQPPYPSMIRKEIGFLEKAEIIGISKPPPRESVTLPRKPILRPPSPAFPEDPNPTREGVASREIARNPNIPRDARWTKITRRLVNPEALERGKERYEARGGFVIVLRVLTKDEIRGYAQATKEIRRKESEHNSPKQSAYALNAWKTRPRSIDGPYLGHVKPSQPQALNERSRASSSNSDPGDDVLLLNGDITCKLKFPAYSIADGKLRVRDLRERTAIVLDLPLGGAGYVIFLFYRGKFLKDDDTPCRDYGLKHQSKVLCFFGKLVEPRAGEATTDDDDADEHPAGAERVQCASQ